MDVVGLSRRELYISRSGPSGSGTVFFFFGSRSGTVLCGIIIFIGWKQ